MISDEQVMSRPEKVVYKWDEIDWRKLERSVFKLQKRIYQAPKGGAYDKCHITEEPYDGKLSRAVLESSQEG